MTLFARRVELRTAMTPEHCRERLAAQVGRSPVSVGVGIPPATFGIVFESRLPMCGRVGERGFAIRFKPTEWNSFQTEMRGRWERGADGGTRIRAVAGMSWFALVFMAVLAAMGVFLVMTMFDVIPFLETEPTPWGTRLMGFGFLAWFAFLLILGRWSSRSEERALVFFLVYALHCDRSVLDQFADDPRTLPASSSPSPPRR